MKVLLDTSVLIPALIPTLPQHEKAAPHLESVHRGETALILTSPLDSSRGFFLTEKTSCFAGPA
ncbi:Hypothetical protein, secreted [Salinibacter ruber M8]|uniref:PIN domain-containing protein n=1 Tax=Salinibacter ruber (strain M8) TaxID=761659 RepID=D5H557_SALRM|nr:Hypothetical protein, secreted [Salinibacter ruber M8]